MRPYESCYITHCRNTQWRGKPIQSCSSFCFQFGLYGWWITKPCKFTLADTVFSLSNAMRTQQRTSETLTSIDPRTSRLRSVGCWFSRTTEYSQWANDHVSPIQLCCYKRLQSSSWTLYDIGLTPSGKQIFLFLFSSTACANLMQFNYTSPNLTVNIAGCSYCDQLPL